MYSILVQFNNLKEAEIATIAVEAYRNGQPIQAVKQPGLQDLKDDLVAKLETALSAYPDNGGVKTAVLRALYDKPSGEWMSYPEIVKTVAALSSLKTEEAENRTPAAIRDLSWQVKQSVNSTDLTGKQKAIELLAERIRSGGTFRYRLTKAGRIAANKWLHS